MIVTLDIPDVVVPEINAIAVSQGFMNGKELVVHFLTETVKRSRRREAEELEVTAVLPVSIIT